jgi:hypothetical protein
LALGGCYSKWVVAVPLREDTPAKLLDPDLALLPREFAWLISNLEDAGLTLPWRLSNGSFRLHLCWLSCIFANLLATKTGWLRLKLMNGQVQNLGSLRTTRDWLQTHRIISKRSHFFDRRAKRVNAGLKRKGVERRVKDNSRSTRISISRDHQYLIEGLASLGKRPQEFKILDKKSYLEEVALEIQEIEQRRKDPDLVCSEQEPNNHLQPVRQHHGRAQGGPEGEVTEGKSGSAIPNYSCTRTTLLARATVNMTQAKAMMKQAGMKNLGARMKELRAQVTVEKVRVRTARANRNTYPVMEHRAGLGEVQEFIARWKRDQT